MALGGVFSFHWCDLKNVDFVIGSCFALRISHSLVFLHHEFSIWDPATTGLLVAKLLPFLAIALLEETLASESEGDSCGAVYFWRGGGYTYEFKKVIIIIFNYVFWPKWRLYVLPCCFCVARLFQFPLNYCVLIKDPLRDTSFTWVLSFNS